MATPKSIRPEAERAHVLFTGTMAVLEGLTRIGKLPSMLPLLLSACRGCGDRRQPCQGQESKTCCAQN